MKRLQGFLLGILLFGVLLVSSPIFAAKDDTLNTDNSIKTETITINQNNGSSDSGIYFGGYYQGTWNQNMAKLFYRESDYPALNLTSDYGTTLYINVDTHFFNNVVFNGDVQFNGTVDFSNAKVIGLD
jgi:hypothetical protein